MSFSPLESGVFSPGTIRDPILEWKSKIAVLAINSNYGWLWLTSAQGLLRHQEHFPEVPTLAQTRVRGLRLRKLERPVDHWAERPCRHQVQHLR